MKFIIPLLHRFGDMILTTPLFRSLKNHYPYCEIYVVASSANHLIIKNNPDIEKIFIFDRNPIKIIKLITQLKLQKFDFLIDPKDHFSSESYYLAKIINADSKIGFNSPEKSAFNIQIPSDKENENLHFVDRCNQVLKFAGVDEKNFCRKPMLFPDINSEKIIKTFINSLPKKKNLMINISAGKPIRRMSEEKWINVINSIDDNYNFIFSAEPDDYQKLESILGKVNKSGVFYKCSSFIELISLVNNVDIVFTPDTSVVHIASAFNKPICAIFNGIMWSNNKFAPLSDIKNIIMSEEDEELVETIPDQLIIDELNKFLNSI